MKAKIVTLMLVVTICLTLVGCGNKKGTINNQNNEEANQVLNLNGLPNIKNSYEGNMGYTKYDINCDEMLDAVDAYDHYFIAYNALYQVNFHKKYSSTGTNCRLIDNEHQYKRFFGGDDYFVSTYLLTVDNTLYKYEKGEILINNDLVIPQKYLDKLDNIYASKMNDDDRNDINIPGRFDYFLLEGNQVYYLGNFLDKEELVFTANDNEKIISMNGNILKTDKKYYSYYNKILNRRECDEYADIPCQEEKKFHEDGINKYYDKIKFYRTPIVVDYNNNIYAYGMNA